MDMSNGECWKWLEVGNIWPLTLRAVFVFFFSSDCTFEWFYLATSFSVRWCIFRISRSRFSFNVMGPTCRSRQRNSKLLVGNCWGLIGISVTNKYLFYWYCSMNAGLHSIVMINIYRHAFTFWHHPGIELGIFRSQVGHSTMCRSKSTGIFCNSSS